MTTHSAGSASKSQLAKFQFQLLVALCGVALAAFFPHRSSAQVTYYDFNGPATAPASPTSTACLPNSAPAGVLFCLNYGALETDGISLIQDTYPPSIDPNAGTDGDSGSINYALQLTLNAQSQDSSVWYSIPQDVADGFDLWYATKISYTPDPSVGHYYTADGMAFVIQNAAGGATDSITSSPETGSGLTVLGAGGGALGYAGIDNSVALEMDTFYDAPYDPYDNVSYFLYDSYADNHMALQSCGAGNPNSPAHLGSPNCLIMLGTSTPVSTLVSDPYTSAAPPAAASAVILADGNPHQVVIKYNGPNDSPSNYLYVYLDPAFNSGTHTPVAGSVPLFAGTFDITQYIKLSNGGPPYGPAYIGFTAGTGGDYEQHEVMGFSFTPHNAANINVCPFGQTTPAPCSITIPVNFNIPAGTFISSVQVVTQGQNGYDFHDAVTGDTCSGNFSTAGSCTVNVVFAPLAPGLRVGAVNLINAGTVIATQFVSGVGQGPEAAFSPLTTFVQNSEGASYSAPMGVAVDVAGNVFVADTGNQRVVEVTGHASQIVGTQLLKPQGVAVDGAGNLYVADSALGSTGEVVKLAPGCTNSSCWSVLYTAQGPHQGPFGVAVDGSDNVFVADNPLGVFEIPANGSGQTTLYNPTSSQPTGVAVDGAGDLFISDSGLQQVVEFPAGCGSSCPKTIGSGWSSPASVAVDAAGDVIVADSGQREVIEVPAGCTTLSCQIDVADPTFLSLANTFQPFDAVPDSQGDIYIADVANNRIDVTLNEFQAFNFTESSVGDPSGNGARSVLFQNIGNQTLAAAGQGLVFTDPNFSQVPGSGTPADCTASFSLVPGAACNLSVNYDPMSSGPATGYADFYDNNLNNPASIQAFPFTGTGVSNGIEYSLTVANGGPGSGTVTDNLTAINCILSSGNTSGTCSGSYESGAPVTLMATPSGGASFLGWGGACASSGTSSTCVVTMNAAQNVTAQFGQPSLGNINVCTLGGVGQPPCSSSQQVTFTATATVSNAVIQVVTQGTGGLDFTLGSMTCGVGGTIPAGVPCTITVNFAPLAPGLRLGAVEISGFANSVNGLVASIPVSGIGQAPEIAYSPASPAAVTLGGGYSFSQPVAVDADGNIYFATNDQVYKKTSLGVQTLPSDGEFGGADSIAVDGAGDVFIADNEQARVFELPANGSAQTTVYPPLHSSGVPRGIAVDGEGDLFVADSYQNEVVEISADGGSNTVLYGPPSSGASVNSVAVDAVGDLFIALDSPGSIVEIPAGCSSNSCQTTVGAGWNAPAALALDAAGNLYVADPELASGNGEIVQVTPGCSSTACQYVLANGNTISGGVNAFSLALDGQGNVYYVNVGSNENGVSSHAAQLVEIAQSQVPSLNFGATTAAGTSSSPQPVTLQNIGNQPLSVGVFSVGSPFNQVFNGNDNPADCTNSGNFNLSPAQSCTASITFNPPAGQFYSADVEFTDDSLNTDFAPFQQIALSGTGTGGVVSYSLTVSTAGTGSGSLGGTNCSTGSYPTGTTVTCTENAGGGSQFTGWSGTCSGAGSCSFTLTGNSTVVANFATSLSYALTVTEIGSGTGTVTSLDTSISCTSGSTTGCSSSYPSGTPVTLTAATTGTSIFAGWGGACASSGTSATCNVTMNSALNVTASFAQQSFGNVKVCPPGQSTSAPCSQSLTLTYNLAATTMLGATQVVTQGVGGLDFSLASGSTCTGTITAGNSCTVNVNFAPLAPGLRTGAVRLYDSGGNLVATTLIYGVGQAPEAVFGPGTQTTIATTLPANGFNQPYGLAVDAAGDVFFGEPGANVVHKLTPGGVQTSVGTFSGHPYGLAVDGAGDLFVADLNSNQVDKITPGGVQTVVPASGLTQPIGVAVDGAGNLFISDRNDNRVVKLTPSGVQTTLPTVNLNQPYGLAVDSAGNVFIADQNNNRVIEVTPAGVQSTVPTAGLTQPYGVAVDAADDVFIVSFANDRVIEVTPAGVQTTVAATGLSGASGVALDGAGDVFISDYNNYRVVEMQSSQLPSLSFGLTNVSSTSSPQSVSIQNVGNQQLTGSLLLSLGGNFLENGGSNCSGGFALAPGASCSESFSFTPLATGYLTGTANFSDNTLNLFSAVVLQTVNLAGEGGLNGQLPGVAVPNVVGLTQAAATTAITSAGLMMGTVSTASSPIVSSGSVTASNPTAGTQVLPGSTVRLLVSTGVAPLPTPNPLSFENNYFLTGDYAAAGITLRGTGHSGFATGTITIPDSSTPGSQGVPDGADIIDGFLYWETLENTATPSGNNGTFLGFPISGQQVGSDQPFTDGSFAGTLRVYRADVNTYFPVATDGSGIRSGSGGFTVSLPDSGGTGYPLTEGASLVVLYRVLSPNFPLKSVVIYDGSGIPSSSTSQNVLGFYDAVGGSSPAESTTLSYAPGGTPGGNWNNSFTSFSLSADATQYSAPLNSGNAYAAVIFSTPVTNSDNDGILDAWKAGPPSGDFYSGGPGYYDTKTGGWIPLPGAKHGEKDLFVQLDYMCGSVSSGTCDPNQENLFPSPDSNGNDPLAIVQNSFAANGVVLHLEIGNAVPEDDCTDNTSTTPAQLCQFPGEKGVIGWKNSLEFSKLWPRNFASCAAGGDCSPRFPYGQKDSYHYVLFGHSLAIPAWNTRYDSLTSINVVNGITTIVTTDRGTGINYCPSRITIAGVLGNPSLNGVYNTTSCASSTSITVSTPGVQNWSYPNNTMPEPGIGLTSGTVTSISGYSDLGGADSAVTLGLWETAMGQDMSKRANVIAGTLFHEIGHTLGLTHGGLYYDGAAGSYVPTFEANCKPNYQSSMNYLFQLDGVGPNAAVAFSNQTLTTIPDASLANVTQLTDLDPGLMLGKPATFPTSSWYTSTPPSSTASAASLHCDGSPLTGDTGYRVNGNVDPISPAWTAGQNITFDGVSYSKLRGYNDQANIDLRQVGATGGELASLASVLSFGSSTTPLNVAAGGNVTLGAGGTVALGAGGMITLGAGGNATISSGSTITPAGGTIALNNGGTATLSNGGTVTLGAGGNVTLGVGGNVTLGAGGTISYSSGGNVTLGAGGNVTLGAGGTISLIGGGNVTIPSTGGPYSYLIPPTGGTVMLNAGGNVTLGAGGNVTLGAGGTIALGAGGNVTLGAGGNVTLGAGGTIALGAGGNVTLGAGGNVTLGAGGTIALGAGGNVTLGAGGNVTLGAGGTVTLGAGGNVTLGAGGNVTLGAGGTVTLGAGGNVTLGAGGTITLGAGGNVTLGAGGTITESGGSPQPVGPGNYTVSAGGTVAMGAGGNVTLGAGGTVTLGAGGNVTLGAGGTVALGAGGNVTLGAGGTVALGAGGNVTLGAGGESTSELTYLTANSVVRPPSLPTETPMPSQTSVVVNWTAPIFGVVQTYTISRSSNGAPPIVVGSVSGIGGNPPATTFTDTNPDFISQTVMYTIGTTLLPVPIDPTQRQSPPSAPAVQTNNQTIVLGTLDSSVSISTSPLTVTATAESESNGVATANGLQVNFSATGSCSIASQNSPDSNGVSSASVALNSTGTCTITASQPGTNLLQPGIPPYYNAATPVSGTFTIQLASSNTKSQTILNFSQLPTIRYGGTFSLSASSSVGLQVTFAASGPCTTSGTTTGVGLCTITASAQAGNVGTSTYSAASATQSFTIQPAVLTVAATSTSGIYGESSLPPLTYTTSALVNGDPSTAVTGAPVLSTTATTASSPGGYPITVSTGTLAATNYSFLYLPGTLTIQTASQAITFTSTIPSSAAFNSSFTVTATGGASGNPVIFTSSGSCSITGTSPGSATYTITNSAGTCSVIANQAGNTNYSLAPTVTQTVNANGPAVTVSPSNINFGTVSQGSITTKTITITNVGTAAVTINQPLLSIVQGGTSNEFVAVNLCPSSLAVGKNCSITIAFVAGPYYTAQTATLEIMDNAPGSPQSVTLSALVLTPQTITFTANPPASAAYKSSFPVAATGGASGNPVTFTSSGVCTNSGSTYTMTASTGTCSVIANQAANSTYAAATQVTKTVTATVAPQSIMITKTAPPSAAYKTSFTVSATGGASGNAVTFTSSGSCTNSSGTYTMTKSTGTCSVIANQAGNSNYSAAAQVTSSVTATLAPQAITFTQNAPSSAAYNTSFTVSATGGASGNSVTYTSSGVCSNSGATYKMTSGTGSCSVIANQAGNSNYSAAAPVTQSVTATLIAQTIAFTTNPPASAAYNTSFTVVATGGASGIAVTFTSTGACTNSGATYKMTAGTGTCSVIANQAGNSNYAAAAPVTKSVSATYSVATLGPASLSFGTVSNGRSSASQAATLTNTGTTPLVVSSIGFTGTNPGNFSQTNTCPSSSSSLAAGKSCTISVTFNSGGKAVTASLTVTDNTQAGTQSVSLSGN